MKKRILLTAVLLWAGALLYGDTGALGYEWARNFILDKHKIEEVPIEGDDLIIGKVTCQIFKKETEVYLFYLQTPEDEYILGYMAYYLDQERTQELKGKLKKVYEVENAYPYFYEDLMDDPMIKTTGFEVVGLAQLSSNAFIAELTGLKYLNMKYGADGEETNSKISVYDYTSSDTAVYIFDNFMKDRSVVVYMIHEQDF